MKRPTASNCLDPGGGAVNKHKFRAPWHGGGTWRYLPPQRVRGHTPLVECRFLCFLVFYIFFAFEVTHANHVLATVHTIPNVYFFGNWVENLKVTIHQLHRSRWISVCNDQTFSSGCKSAGDYSIKERLV